MILQNSNLIKFNYYYYNIKNRNGNKKKRILSTKNSAAQRTQSAPAKREGESVCNSIKVVSSEIHIYVNTSIH